MMEEISQKEVCPRCKSSDNVEQKLVMLGLPKVAPRRDWCGMQVDSLPLWKVSESALSEPPLEQFYEGYYCTNCEVAFVEDEIILNPLPFN